MFQNGTLTPDGKSILENFGFNPFEVDFQSDDPISDNLFISEAFYNERELINKHKEDSFQTDPLLVMSEHVKVKKVYKVVSSVSQKRILQQFKKAKLEVMNEMFLKIQWFVLHE